MTCGWCGKEKCDGADGVPCAECVEQFFDPMFPALDPVELIEALERRVATSEDE